MKRKIISAAALLMALGAASAAHAQSSVTLYGIIDAGIGFTHNVASAADKSRNANQVSFTNSQLIGNRWGLRGREDLGGGLQAVFVLESGFRPGTGALGQGGREFGRQAYVGIGSQAWGTVTLGRQYDALKDLLQPLSADNVWGTVNVTPGDLDNYDNSGRVSNAIKYTSPSRDNLKLVAMYAFGGAAGDISMGQTAAVAGTYKFGGVTLGAGYYIAKFNPGNTAFNTSDVINNSLASGAYALAAQSLQIARAVATYDIGGLTVGAGYSNTRYKPAVALQTAFSETEAFNAWSAFVNYKFTPAVIAGLSYSYTNSNGSQSAHYNQLGAGAQYLLSVRTSLYALVGYQRSAGQTLSGKLAVPATASIGDGGLQSASGSQLGAYFGITHRF
ncbi:porin [Burkholderia sp. 22PA0106]|uniref:porin n=1 Tax=Burkholderia sp. 22PA0106 TaxID=3237371 RepID=UPI0039C0615E